MSDHVSTATSDADSVIGALEPLFGPSEYPNAHRQRGETPGTARIASGRRPSPLQTVRRIRSEVDDWRRSAYAGASATTRNLLSYWFQQSHVVIGPSGEWAFAYYFCQQEA